LTLRSSMLLKKIQNRNEHVELSLYIFN
jgi:hypothetical protein